MINKSYKLLTAGLASLALLSGCSIDKDGLSLYGDTGAMVSYLRFEHRAYNLAAVSPHDTVTLKVGAYNMNGERVHAPIEFHVTNNFAMEIDSAGLLKAKSTASGALIRATATIDGVTRRDSAYVTITAAVPAALPERVTFELNPGDSAKQGESEQFRRGRPVRVIREDANGNNMSALRVGVWQSDKSKAGVTQSGNNATVIPYRPGKITLYISSYAYGRAFFDSLEYMVGWPVTAYLSAYSIVPGGSREPIVQFHPQRITVGIGACVHWTAARAQIPEPGITAAVEFEDTSGIAPPQNYPACNASQLFADSNAGNIPAFGWEVDQEGGGQMIIGSDIRARVFTKPGLYKYRHPVYNTTAEIYVCDEINDSSCNPALYKWEEGR